MMNCRQMMFAGGIALELLALSNVRAQGGREGESDRLPIPDSVRQAHMVHVSPHLLVLDPHKKTATLEFKNQGNTPIQAEVEIQFGFTDWPDKDPISPSRPHFPNARDTVILSPEPKDRSLVSWISGVPTHLALKAHETQRVTIRVDPPANLPAGEYYARVLTIVQPQIPQRGTVRDAKAVYHFPIKAAGLPSLRDSARVFYRQGALKLGVDMYNVSTGIGKKPSKDTLQLKDDWIRIPFHLTGNMPFDGQLKHYFRNDATGDTVVALTTQIISLQRDGVIHHWCDVPANQSLPPGHYTIVITLDATQDEFPASLRVPMKPVHASVSFEIK